MKVSRDKLVALMLELGVDTASEWDVPTLAAKVNRDGGIARYEDPPGSFAGTLKPLFGEIADAQKRGEAVEVEEVREAERHTPEKKEKARERSRASRRKKAAAAAARPAKKAAGKVAGAGRSRRATGSSWEEQKAYRAKNPLQITDRGPGVMRTVVAELKAAGKGSSPKGVTKDHLLDVLKRTFEDRDPTKMQTNLSNIVPGRLKREYGIHVWKRKNESGETLYFIKGDGKTPQPAR